MDKIFAYGTLLFEDEDPNHGVDTYRYILDTKEGRVRGKLYAIEGFPFLVLDENDDNNLVIGKLFTCKEIEHLLEKYDRIQGATQIDPFFERKVVDVILEDGEQEKGFCYVAGIKLRDSFAKEKYRIRSGDWRKIPE